MSQITISDKCIRCGHCVRVCPVGVLKCAAERGDVTVEKADRCISCGQCAAVCPTGALSHSTYPASAIHRIDRAGLPTPEQTMLLIKQRRSNRSFTDQVPADELVGEIIEAANAAPTAANSMDMHYAVVSSPETLQAIIRFVGDTFAEIAQELPADSPVAMSMQVVAEAVAAGRDVILREAPMVIFFLTEADGMFSVADANLAYQNASLMAESLGISQVYLGYLCRAIKSRPGRLESLLGLSGHIQAAMAIGHTSIKFPNYLDRPAPQVSRL